MMKIVFLAYLHGFGGAVSLSNCMIYVRNHTFGKFYKLSKCRDKGIEFPPLKRCEDVAFVIRAIIACESAYYLDEPLYYYYQRPTSLSNNTKLDERDMIRAFNILEAEYKDTYPRELKEKSVTDLLYGVVLMMCKSGKTTQDINAYIQQYETKYPEWEKSEIIKHIGKAKALFLRMVKGRNVIGMRSIAKIHTLLIGRH
jgi:DNA polymerase III delta prime subunit